MNQSEQKVVQYLNEAHATEVGLVSVLQSQIAITPEGSYREGLEKHLNETRSHAERLRERLEELEHGGNPFQALVGFSEAVIGQMVALSKAPFDLWRGASGAEKVLKDAKDACASEALEIATYTALERLATKVGDTQTARLAASIRGDEERMLARIQREIPKLTDAVAEAEIESLPSAQGAAGAAREVARQATKPRRTARANKNGQADKNGRARRGAQANKPRRPSSARRGGETSPNTPARSESTNRPSQPRSAEPWAGYDQLTVAEIEAVLNEGDLGRAQAVADYERAHKNRPEVIRSAIVPARFVLSTAGR